MVREPSAQAAHGRRRKPLDELGREPDRRRQRGRRARQHHGHPVLARGGRGAGRRGAGVAADARRASTPRTPSEYDTFSGEAVRAAPGRQPQAAPARDEGRPARQRRRRGRVPRVGTVALSAVRPRAQPIEEGHAHAPPRGAPRRRRRRVITPGRLLIARLRRRPRWPPSGSRPAQIYFVGVDESRGNVVTLYQGLPYDLPARHPALLARSSLGRDLPERAGRAPQDASPTTSCVRKDDARTSSALERGTS